MKHLRATDLRAIAQLATQATAGVARIAEGVHQSVWSSMGVPGGKAPGSTRGLTGLIYQSVQGVNHWVGKGLDAALARLQPLLERVEAEAPETPEREAVLAALNGVMGDRLLASQNPLATPMTLRCRGQALEIGKPLTLPQATGKVLLLIHGLCMNDLQWQTGPQGQIVDHGAALAAQLGYTPVYLRYNSGLHVSTNARELSLQLEQLLGRWPQPVQELTVVAHSMGGLLTRSAFYHARQAALRWPDLLKNIVFLGTPHHGAPLERAGNWVDVLLGSSPYSRPFARLAQLRSAGITDLRYGHLLDADWQGRERFQRQPDRRQTVALPDGVNCYAIVATMAPKRGLLADRLTGDGLVPLRSALGQHDDPSRSLAFAANRQLILYRSNHMDLLSREAVTQQLLQWLSARTPKLSSLTPKLSSLTPKLSSPTPKLSSPTPKLSSPTPKLSSPTPKLSSPTPKLSSRT
jgi:pimeloyl-ACP methyl ester carboxylesterase